MGVALVTKRIVNTCHRSAILVVHSIVGGAAVLMVKLGARRSASVYKGDWAYRTRSEAFKDKARLQLHSKSFGLKQLSNIFVCKIPKFKADFILKFKVVCVATRTLVISCYSHDYHNCSNKLTVVIN